MKLLKSSCMLIYVISVVQIISGDEHLNWNETYDYIIVGGGTAGCVLAARLSEDEKVNVLVVEAGGETTDPFIRIPATWLTASFNAELNWGYVTEPQPISPTNKTVAYSQAKVLGGTSSFNALKYTRGSRHDYDNWYEMGNYNWSYNDVLPYFKKSEMMLDPALAANGFHGTKGMWKTRIPDKSPIVEELVKSAVEIGFKELEDYNGPELEGVSYTQLNVDERGERSNTYETFLRPVMTRRNLHVLTNAHVTKVSFDVSGGVPRANGVYFIMDKQSYFIKARIEVIVSSGGIGSPTILMRSGIGPKEHLQSLGINVVSDLPVGNSLQDHPIIPLTFYLNKTTQVQTANIFSFEALFDQLFTGTGPWSGSGVAMLFYKSKTQPVTDFFPYMEHTFHEPPVALYRRFSEVIDNVRKGNKITKQMVEMMMNSTEGNIPISANIFYLHQRQQGMIRLKSTNPLENPKIKYDYLTDPDDIKDVIEAIRNIQKIISTNVMQIAKAIPITESDASCKNHVFDTDSYWKCYISYNFRSASHYTSTCKMAPDATGVVDDRLRVKGVLGLRVADSSIMPQVTSGHTTAPTVMIAEKAADMIKMDMLEDPRPTPSSGNLPAVTIMLIISAIATFACI